MRKVKVWFYHDQLEQRQAEMLDEELRRLPAVQTASMGVIPDPRLASWAEMCAIGRAFVVRHPTRSYAPMSDEFKEMIAIYMGAPSPLAAQIGVGRRVRCPSKNRENLTLDKCGDSRCWWAKSPADPPIRGALTTTP